MDASDLLRRAYDREAPFYDARFRDQQEQKYAAVAQSVPAPDAGLVVDVGGGTGMLKETLIRHDARWGASTFAVIDLSHGMLLRAHSRSQLVIQADARRLPLAPGVASRIISVTGIVEPAHLERALVSAVRVCAPGGFVAFSLLQGAWIEGLELRLPLEPVVQKPVRGDVLRVWKRR